MNESDEKLAKDLLAQARDVEEEGDILRAQELFRSAADLDVAQAQYQYAQFLDRRRLCDDVVGEPGRVITWRAAYLYWIKAAAQGGCEEAQRIVVGQRG